MTHFYLGTHQPHWLARLDVPLFVSHRRLRGYKRLPVARVGWALDSGGFTELTKFGEWRTGTGEYIEAARRYRDEVGLLDWAAPMDWMCEPPMLAKTGLSVDQHQKLTVENFLHLRQEAPDVGFIPVLQGWGLDDYLACADLYEQAGVDLTVEPVVGVGSVCRRQHTDQIARIFAELHHAGIACHGFGVKIEGLSRYGRHLTSADSMAWSYEARRSAPLPRCTTHKNCANCEHWAMRWRGRVLRRLVAEQPTLW